MDDVIRFGVPGCPVGKGRPRFVRATGRTYTPEKTVNFENLVKIAYNDQIGTHIFDKDCELAIRIEARFPIPKSVSKKQRMQMQTGIIRHTKKPDSDNLLKSVADALNGVAYYDDSQIVYAEITKRYAELPETIVTLWRL